MLQGIKLYKGIWLRLGAYSFMVLACFLGRDTGFRTLETCMGPCQAEGHQRPRSEAHLGAQSVLSPGVAD